MEISDWKNVNDELPPEIGRYLCYVDEISDIGVSHYQWNCSYSPEHGFNTEYRNSPSDGYVTHWTYFPDEPEN